jgi:hypothetical protein
MAVLAIKSLVQLPIRPDRIRHFPQAGDVIGMASRPIGIEFPGRLGYQ